MGATAIFRLSSGSHTLRVARGGVRPWLPDLSAVAAFLTFLYVLFFFHGYTRLFHDSDAGWHIRSGEQILRTSRLPMADPYSFSRAGQPWMNWEWLSDVAAGSAHRAAGLGGVALLYAAAIAVTVWCWFQVQWRLGGNFLLACALAVPLLGTINLHWLARPHVFSWVLTLAALWCAEAEPSRRRLVFYAVLAAVWANIHGSFLLAPLMALLYAVSRWLRPLIWNLDRKTEWAEARYYSLAALVAAAAGLLNPYGWQLHRHVLRYLGDRELLASVGEFQSFNFHVEGAGQILLALGLAAAGTVAALARRRLDHFFLGAAIVALALRSARGLPLVALVVLPIAGAHLSEIWRALGESAALRPRLARWLKSSFEYGARLGEIDRSASRLWLAPALLVSCAVSAPFAAARTGFPGSEFPVAAAARLEQMAPELFQGSGRLLAPDKFGGYLIYRFDGRLKVFFDGRSDFYGAPFLDDYRRLAQVRPGWQDELARFGFTHALLPKDYSLVDALERSGWTVLYRDDTAVLLRKPGAVDESLVGRPPQAAAGPLASLCREPARGPAAAQGGRPTMELPCRMS